MTQDPNDGKTGLPFYLRADLLAGIFFAVLALVIWREVAGLDTGSARNFGPGMLPRLLVALLFVCAAVLILSGLLQAAGSSARFVLALRGPAMIGIAIFVFASTVRGYGALPQLGLLVAGPLTVLLAGLGSSEADWRELLVLGFGLTAASVLVFSDLLGMQVPAFPGFVEKLLPVAWGVDWPKRAAALVYGGVTFALWHVFGMSVGGEETE